MRTTNTRVRLLEAADQLVQEKGFHRTTLADLAGKARVRLGNVYYYFKTKRALGDAVIHKRLERYRRLLEEWEELDDPRQRLLAFVEMAAGARHDLARKGCPIGSLCQELHKEGGPLAKRSSELFRQFLTWAERQFRQLGKGKEAHALALHVMSALQGASLLALTFDDPRLVATEAKMLEHWLETV